MVALTRVRRLSPIEATGMICSDQRAGSHCGAPWRGGSLAVRGARTAADNDVYLTMLAWTLATTGHIEEDERPKQFDSIAQATLGVRAGLASANAGGHIKDVFVLLLNQTT
jgi:hypothetical protein